LCRAPPGAPEDLTRGGRRIASSKLPRPILIVEDDASLRDALAQVLSFGGYAVATAADGAAALEVVRSANPPCLILADLVMAGMDGWELCAELRRLPAAASIPVVVLSAAWNLHNERTTAIRAAATLLKPINFKRLFELVERFCGAAVAPREAIPLPVPAASAKKAR
jgi:CheY-like chemotaxis protein